MTSQRYMLDTNTVSYIIKGEPVIIRERLRKIPMENISVSVITQAELLHGVAKKRGATRLALAVNEFLLRVDILPWDSNVASAYSQLRTNCEQEGKPLGAMDMLIAAHSVAVGTILITSDKAFYNVGHYLSLEDWTVC